jgi:carbonic anhydrase
MATTSRRSFLFAGGLAAAGLATGTILDARLPPGSKKALDELMAGNERFASDKAECPPLTARRLELAEGQHPFAIILSCSDSRVPLDTVFDQVPGSIFGVRVAGNFVDDDGLGSMEYAVEHLHSSLILVLGHSKCGAVIASVEFVKNGTPAPSYVQNLVKAIEPAAASTKGKPGDWVENACVANVKNNVAALTARSHIVAEAVEKQTVSIAGGVYNLKTGRVTIVT